MSTGREIHLEGVKGIEKAQVSCARVVGMVREDFRDKVLGPCEERATFPP